MIIDKSIGGASLGEADVLGDLDTLSDADGL